MLRRAHTGAHLALILIVVLLTTSVVFAQDAKPEPVGLRPDAPTYAVHGSYWVGARDFVIEDKSRPLHSSIWYPALNPSQAQEAISYTGIIIKWDAGISKDMTLALEGHALQDAEPNMIGGPYPLVIISHGYGDFRAEYAYLAEHLASYGFTVIVPDHVEFWTPEVADLWKDTVNRPHDIQRVIAYADTLTGATGAMEGLINMQQIAVLGHSYGGYTALAMGGARINFNEFRARCTALPTDSQDYAYCAPLVDHEVEIAALAGLDSAPKGNWPSVYDPRIKAVVSMAGDSYHFGTSGMAEFSVPLLVMNGSVDTGTAIEWGGGPAYDNASSSQKAKVVFEDAGHFIYTASCQSEPWMVDTGWSFFCLDDVWDKERAHDLINHFTSAFLLDVLKGDKDAHAALAPDAVKFPGIQYEAQGY